jgi:hypothetical protein
MLGAYWDARPDALEKCTKDAVQFFARLAEIDPLLALWYERGRSRKDALKRRIDTSDTQCIRELLLKRRSRRDIAGEVMDDLGFRLGLWNGSGEEAAEASVDIHCGCYSERIGNNVLIDLPSKTVSLKWVDNASMLLALVAETWRPKWAGIMSKKAMRERDFNGDYPFVDWMVYVPRSVKAVPLPSRVEVLKGLGSIVIVQQDPPVCDDAEELALIRRVERLLAD